ncbi:hypothetical protein [Bradyrhizobium sp. USDA 3315]
MIHFPRIGFELRAAKSKYVIDGADAVLDRSHRISRQILVGASGRGVTCADVNLLTQAIDKKLVIPARLEIRFTWSNGRGERLLQLTLPLTFAT